MTDTLGPIGDIEQTLYREKLLDDNTRLELFLKDNVRHHAKVPDQENVFLYLIGIGLVVFILSNIF